MKCLLSCLFAGFIIVNSVFGQNPSFITGKVSDEQELPIPYATIQLLSQPDSAFVAGAVSDKTGKFEIKTSAVLPERSCLKITFVGYRTAIVRPVKADMGTITLHVDENEISGVVVKGRKPSYTLEGSSVIMQVQNTFLSKLNRVADVMRYLPGVWGDGASPIPTVLGKGKPKVYLNGRLVRDESEVKQLRAREIKQIELDTNPGAEYSSSTEAVIRITTLPRGEGLSGYVDLYGRWSEKGVHVEEISLNYRHKKFDLFGDIEYQRGYGSISNSTNDIRVFTQPDWRVLSTTHIESKEIAYLGTLGFNYQPSKDHTLGMRYRLTAEHPTRTLDRSEIQYFLAGEENDVIGSVQNSEQDNTQHYLNGYYNGKLSKDFSLEFNFDAMLNDADRKQQTVENSIVNNERTINTRSKADNRLLATKAIFEYRMGKHKFRFGGSYTDVNRDNDYFITLDEIGDSDIRTTERKGVGFLDYSYKQGKVTFKAGIRYEHTATNYYDTGVRRADLCRRYDNLFPSASISFPVGKASMSLAYSHSMKRPSFSSLNGSINYYDPYTLGSGNPLLRPTVNQNVTWKTSYQWFYLSASYRHTRDAIMTIRRLYDDAGTMTINHMENLDKAQSLNVNASVSPTIGCWHPKLLADYTQPFVRFETPEGMRNFNRGIFFFSWMNTLELPADFRLSAWVSYTSNGNIHYNVFRKFTWDMDFSITKSFFDGRFEVYVNIHDPFNWYKFDYRRTNPVTVQAGYNRTNYRMFRCALTYYFNKTNKRYKGKSVYGDDISRTAGLENVISQEN